MPVPYKLSQTFFEGSLTSMGLPAHKPVFGSHCAAGAEVVLPSAETHKTTAAAVPFPVASAEKSPGATGTTVTAVSCELSEVPLRLRSVAGPSARRPGRTRV